MKKEFPLKNLKSIEIDHENGMAVACYEEEFTYIKCISSLYDNTTVGKIYKCNGSSEHTYSYIDNNGEYNGYDKGNFKQSTKDDYDKQEEIIEEKKPLYTNSYGTEFFGDEKVWDVQKSTLIIRETFMTTSILIDLEVTLNEDDSCSEILKDRNQCLLWIKDNIHKLR